METIDNNNAGMREFGRVKIDGHLLIKDGETGEILRDKHNAIHYENFSNAIALSMADFSSGVIEEMHFGNGGSVVSATGTISYFPPNTTGLTADLYNDTYFKIVDNRSARYSDNPATTNITTNHVTGNTYTDIIVLCTLNYGEPADQEAFDTATTVNSTYTFDEIGLKTYDPNTGIKRLLTHVIFNPVQKALNRVIEVIYTIRISMV
jgi:hypothetical protein